MHYSLTDIILDLVQNSIEAGADTIHLELLDNKKELAVRLQDNGCGMSQEEIQKAKDPFYSDGTKHKQRKLGLGIPFLIQTVEQTGGRCVLHSEKGRGSCWEIGFNLENMDTPVEGDWPGLFLQAFCFEGNYELHVSRTILGKEGRESGYELSRLELLEILGNFNDSGSMLLLRDYLISQEADTKISQEM